jgi:hypothetical protein
MKAIEQGVALRRSTYQEEFDRAARIIKNAREMTSMLMSEGFIAEAPEEGEQTPAVTVEAHEGF